MSNNNHFENISYLILEVNSECNLECIFCNRPRLVKEGRRAKATMSLENFEFILHKFKDNDIETVKIEGISEPMLNANFDKYCKLMREYFPNVKIIVFTNAQYNALKVPLFKTLEFIDELYLSIDGVRETYEKIRKGASWNRFLKTCDDITQNVPIETRKEKIKFNYTMSIDNYSELDEVYSLQKKYSFKGVSINLVQDWNEDSKNKRTYSEELIKKFKTYEKDIKGVGGWNYSDCYWPYEGCVIDVYGNITQCIINTTMKPIGNIFREDIKELYNKNAVLTNARKGLRSNCPPTQCASCDYKLQTNTIEKIIGRKNKPRKFKMKNCNE
jgi:radical SAM protein with 4Fe4S-binding SPASM domain